MESDNSLILLDQSTSFQILNESESFVVLESSEIASHYDIEDEWLQIETGSVISSMASIIKPDGSIISEYSFLDNMHATALNDGGKLIKTRPDIFVEDQTMRKILEYVSMFYEDVSLCLKSSRSSQALISSQVMNEDWEISSLIDLDDISVELLGLLLDTLEEFGMYKLCLIVCNRYNLSNRLGRYIVSLSSKYSNLYEIKHFDHKGTQVQRAAIAYTAVHNVLEMINPEYLSLKEADGKNLGVEAFRSLLLLGYWKKTVYIMDFDNSLAVTKIFGDFKNFKKVYLMRNGKMLTHYNRENFDWLTQGELSIDVAAYKMTLDSVITNFNGMRLATLQKNMITYADGPFPIFPSFFQYNQTLWEFLMNQTSLCVFEEKLKEIFSKLYTSIKSPLTALLDLHDIYTFFSQLVFISTSEPKILNFISELSFEDFEKFLQVFNWVCIELTPQAKSIINTFSILSPFAIREIVPSQVTAVYPYLTYAMIHKSCYLLSDWSPPNSYIPDLEGHYMLVPLLDIKQYIFRIFTQKLIKILMVRLSYLQKTQNSLSAEANFFGEIWMFDFIRFQISQASYKLSSYNYCKLDNKMVAKHKELQAELQEILSLGESDYYSEMYIRMERNADIKRIKNEIRKIENIRRCGDVVDREESLLKLVNLAENSKEKVELTETAKAALLTQIQVFTKCSENGKPVNILKSMWVAYQIAKIAGYTDFYLEILRSRFKKVIFKEKKFTKVSPAYETALGFMDVDVYWRHGHMEEVFFTILHIFESDFLALDIERKTHFVHKAALAWVISTNNEFSASKQSLYLCNAELLNNDYCLSGIFQSNFSPDDLFPWLILTCKELGTTEINETLKKTLAKCIYESVYLLLKYCKSDLFIPHQLKNPENHIIIGLVSDILKLSLNFKAFYDIFTEKDLEFFKSTYKISKPVCFKITDKKSKAEVLKSLDSDWNSEVLRLSHHHYSCRVILKLTKKIKVSKKSTQFDLLVSQHTPSLHITRILYTYYSELMDLLYRVALPKVLDFHHVMSKFSYVADIMLKLSNWKATPIEKLSLKEEIRDEIASFITWKKIVSPTIENPNPGHQKKYRMKWPHKLRLSRRHRR